MKLLVGMSSILPETVKYLEKRGHDVLNNPYGRKLTQKELIELLEEIDGVLAGLEVYNKETLNLSKLKVISRCGSGMENIDIEEAERLKIKIYNTPEGPLQSVAELSIGCLISLLRKVEVANRNMRHGIWKKEMGHLLSEQNVLIIGYGRIGRKVSSILTSIGSSVYIYDPMINDSDLLQGHYRTTLSEGIKKADIIMIHASGDKLILGENQFKLMKKNVYICNASRGNLIDESQLLRGIKNKNIAGAWLDVFQNEPYKGPFLNFDQILLTPHIASYTIEGRRKMELQCAENLILGLP